MESEQAFGDVLREMRRRRKLSQEALALEAGVERNYISLLELGKNSASVRIVFKICTVLNVLPSDFFREVEGRINAKPGVSAPKSTKKLLTVSSGEGQTSDVGA